MDINLELYKMFYFIAKEGSITNAANKLFISQSAVTQALKKLEDDLGGKLFIRNKNGVILTDEGEKLFNYIKESINTLNNAENLFSQYLNSEVGKIRINVSSSLGGVVLPRILQIYTEKYPKVKIDVLNDKTSEAKRRLRDGEIDMFILEGDLKEYEKDMELIPLVKYEYCFFTSKEYLDKVGEFCIKKLSEYNFILPGENTRRRKILNEKLSQVNLEISSNYSFNSAQLVKEYVKIGLGIGYINEGIIKNELKNGTFIKLNLGIDNMQEQIAIGVKNIKLLSNSALKFIEITKRIIGEIWFFNTLLEPKMTTRFLISSGQLEGISPVFVVKTTIYGGKGVSRRFILRNG